MEEATLDVRDTAVGVLSFSATLPLKNLKEKLGRCVRELREVGILSLGDRGNVKDCFTKKAKGVHSLTIARGANWDAERTVAQQVEASPLFEPLHAIGFDRRAISRILAAYKPRLIETWADITLAAVERKRIDKTPQAFFSYYASRAAEGTATPPDWWLDARKQMERQEWEQTRRRDSQDQATSFETYLADEAREAFDRLSAELASQYARGGRGTTEARREAEREARRQLRDRFEKSQHGPIDLSRYADRLRQDV